MPAVRVLSETSLKFLEDIGERIQVCNGYRTLSLATVSSASAGSDETIDIPDLLNSAESLEFCGLSFGISRTLYNKWFNELLKIEPGQLGHNESLISLARDHINGMSEQYNAFTAEDNWNEALEKQGIKSSSRCRILDVRFDNIRLSQSARYWALDTLNLSWEFLEGLDNRILETKERASHNISTPPLKAKIQDLNPSSSTTHKGPPLNIETEVPTKVKDRVLVYKGGSPTRLISIFRPDGSLNLAKIVSKPLCDFHPTRRDLYFTTQYDIALQHAEYVHARVLLQEPAVLTVALPSEYTASSVEIVGPKWRKLVWLSNSNNALYEIDEILPQELESYSQAEVLVGPVCGQGVDRINRMESKDELTVLKTEGGEEVVQIVLNGDKMVGRFGDDCRGYVWVGSLGEQKRVTHFPLLPPSG